MRVGKQVPRPARPSALGADSIHDFSEATSLASHAELQCHSLVVLVGQDGSPDEGMPPCDVIVPKGVADSSPSAYIPRLGTGGRLSAKQVEVVVGWVVQGFYVDSITLPQAGSLSPCL